jgi:opacity protein-like surface antigen
MKSTTRILGAVGITLFAACAAHAQSLTENLYVHTDIGPAIVADTPTSVRTFDGSGFTRSRGTFRTDTGIRGDLSLGYNLTKCFAIEAEAGATWNPGPNPGDSFYQIPVMLNAIYQIQLNDSWKAYVGAGAGGVISMAHSLVHNPAFASPIKLDATDWSVGYQAEAGIKYALSPHIDIDLGYKFLGVVGYDYQFGGLARPVFEFVKVNDLFTHSAQVSLTWKF